MLTNRQLIADRVTILGANAGIYVMVRINTELSDRVIIEKAAAVRISLTQTIPIGLL